MRTIIMKFASALQSWGDQSNFSHRGTHRFPTKSAVIGIVAAALGYRRDEDEKLARLQNLSFAVRVDRPGSLLYDYQTATPAPTGRQKGPRPAYTTHRAYLQDATFSVAIGSDDDEQMRIIYEALKAPYFPLYLGRRSEPVNYDYMQDFTQQDVITSLKYKKWLAPEEYQQDHSKRVTLWTDSDLLDREYYQMIRDVPKSFAIGRTNSPYNHTDRAQHQYRSIARKRIDVPLNDDKLDLAPVRKEDER